MCLGIFPGSAIAERYGLDEFYELGNAVRQGNVKQFEEVGAAACSALVRASVTAVCADHDQAPTAVHHAGSVPGA